MSETSGNSEQPARATKMEEELEKLRAEFQGQCKVIDSDGKFSKTIKLHPTDLDIVFNFKVTDNYPITPAVVEVRSESLDDDEIFDLQTYLRQKSADTPDQGMENTVKQALEWLKQERIDVTGMRMKKTTESVKNKKQRRKKKPKESVEKGKKPPMKTAMDVVKRIMWDEALDRDQCLVGYLDRMDGLKEKYFNAFSWEDIASVDYTVLAIPKHRIQYFKYRDVIVWDKRCRLDNVFGSTGSKTTIKDVIAKLDGGDTAEAVADENNDRNNENQQQHLGNEIDAHEDSDYYDSGDITDTDSDDSDDGINVTIGNCAGGAVGGPSYEFEDGNDDLEGEATLKGDDDDTYDKYWRDKLRPNHFVALRITDDLIRENAVKIQKQVSEAEPKLKDCKILPGAMHLTLCTVGLESPEQVQSAVRCLQEAKAELAGFVPKGKKLTFKGVDTFFNRVIYGRVVDCPPEFYDLVEHLKTCLVAAGVEIRDYHEFVPHMTIMKVSRPVAKMTGNNYIAPWLYSSFNETELGSQAVDNLHLCEMVDQRQEDGFYVTAASFEL